MTPEQLTAAKARAIADRDADTIAIFRSHADKMARLRVGSLLTDDEHQAAADELAAERDKALASLARKRRAAAKRRTAKDK